MPSRVMTAALVVAYCGTWAAAPLVVSGTASDLDIFFWPSAQIAAHGHPLLIYSVGGIGRYPVANGPLAMLLLAPIAAVANITGWGVNLASRTAVADGGFAIFVVLLALCALHIIRHARGVIEWRLAASCVFLVPPALWISVVDYGHLEQPVELLLVLLAVVATMRGHPVLTGVALGLAVLTRTTALLYIVPFALLPLASHRPRQAVLTVVAALGTAAAGIAPFLVADGSTVIHSLVTYRGDLPVAGGSLWLLVYGRGLATVVQHGDTYLILAVAAGLCALTLWRRPAAALTPAGLIGLLTVVAACFPMLAKTVFPYYLLEPYVFAAVWWLARPGSAWNWRLAAPLLVTADVFLSKAAVDLPYTGWGLVEGVTSSTIMAAVIGLVLFDLWRQPVAAPAPAAGTLRAAEAAS